MKSVKLILAAALLVVGASQPAAAQEEECVCPPQIRSGVWVAPAEGRLRNVFYFNTRPRLGVFIHTEASPETDRYGALIDEVSDDGPADKAGIRGGDIILELDGQSLLEGLDKYDLEGAPGQMLSGPGQRLSELARELEMGDTITVKYRRDGQTQTTELVVGDFEGAGWAYAGNLPLEIGQFTTRLRELPTVNITGPRNLAIAIGERVPGLELVELNPELGEYFGTEEGVLVISVPEDTELGLQAGDVIQTIDGREVRDPSHAMRILRSYEEDEEVTLGIFRQKRSRTVTGKVPESFSGVYGIRTRREP